MGNFLGGEGKKGGIDVKNFRDGREVVGL